MPESLVSVRFPAVVWLASTALIVADHDVGVLPGVVKALAWLVFVAGVVFFFGHLVR